MLFSLPAFSQKKITVDSIENVLPSLAVNERPLALFELVAFYVRADMNKARAYVYDAIQLRPQVNGAGKAYSFLAEGMFLNACGKIDSGILLLQRAEEYAIANKTYYALLKLYSALSYAHISSGNAERGLAYLYKGLALIEYYPEREIELRLRTNIVWAYLELKQYRNCINFGRQNIRMMETTPYEWIALYSYNNIAVAYGASGMVDSAKYFVSKGIAVAQKSQDMQTLANSYFILGTIYSNAGEYEAAIEQYLKAKPIREKVGNPLFIVSDLYTMADLYHKTGDYKKGIETGLEALKIAEKFGLTLKFEPTYLALAKNYEGIQDHKRASQYYRLHANAKDTVYRNANARAIAEMQTKYETVEKEKQLVEHQVKIIEQQARINRTYLAIIGLIITIIVLVLVFSLIRSRMKRREQALENEKEIEIREAHIHATIQSQESERKRFAQDLHDGMGQLISALRLALNSVHTKSSIEDRVAVTEKGEKILNAMHDEIRGIAFNLMPQTLVKHGLVPALCEMCDRINDSKKIRIQVQSLDMPERLDEVYEVSLYRVIQEWINNIIKYADATSIQVQLTGYEDECNILIEDDGKGFNPLLLEQGHGNGWRNIKSRINLIKSSIEIDSREGYNGTTTIIKVPMKTRGVQAENAEFVTTPVSAPVLPNTH
ncbi:MAG TPA: ATP-binding protein [Chryseosolibacter sp.]|nr:ATP-binding protein [Chryseosolibacter sp.]